MNQRPSSFLCAFFVAFAAAAFGDPPESAAFKDAAVRRIEIVIEDRQVTGGNEVVRVTQGERVELVWTTDEKVRLHLHGYDVEIDVTPEAPAVLALTAHATGRFPVTSHGFGDGHGHDTLLYFEVYPD